MRKNANKHYKFLPHPGTMEHCRMIPLGVTDPLIIPDRKITASSRYSSSYKAAYGRLNGTRGDGWCSSAFNSTFDWLQVDLGKVSPVCAVATQGDVNGNEWTVCFKLFFSSDGHLWRTYRNANGTEMVGVCRSLCRLQYLSLFFLIIQRGRDMGEGHHSNYIYFLKNWHNGNYSSFLACFYSHSQSQGAFHLSELTG